MRERLRQNAAHEVVMALQLEASKWYAEAGLMTEAVKHALAAGDSVGTGRLVEQVILPMLTSGEVTTVIGWLDALPVALHQ